MPNFVSDVDVTLEWLPAILIFKIPASLYSDHSISKIYPSSSPNTHKHSAIKYHRNNLNPHSGFINYHKQHSGKIPTSWPLSLSNRNFPPLYHKLRPPNPEGGSYHTHLLPLANPTAQPISSTITLISYSLLFPFFQWGSRARTSRASSSRRATPHLTSGSAPGPRRPTPTLIQSAARSPTPIRATSSRRPSSGTRRSTVPPAPSTSREFRDTYLYLHTSHALGQLRRAARRLNGFARSLGCAFSRVDPPTYIV